MEFGVVVFIYCNDLKFDKHKKFTINFSNEDSLRGVVFRKNRDYYITSMTSYVDLTVNITMLPTLREKCPYLDTFHAVQNMIRSRKYIT